MGIKNKIKYGNVAALREYLLNGGKITRLESLLYFGVQNLTAVISYLKKDGYIINKENISMLKVLKRVNESIKCTHPNNLPVKEIIMSEWYISR